MGEAFGWGFQRFDCCGLIMGWSDGDVVWWCWKEARNNGKMEDMNKQKSQKLKNKIYLVLCLNIR